MTSILLKIPQLDNKRKSIGLLHIGAGVFLAGNCASLYKLLLPDAIVLLVPIFLAALFFVAYGFLRKKWDPQSRWNTAIRGLQVAAFLALVFLFSVHGSEGYHLGLYAWVLIAATLAFTERAALKQPVALFHKAGITVPGGISDRFIAWKNLADVTLRSDYLTLHFPEERFLQFELAGEPSAEQLQNLQDFCRQHLRQDETSAVP